ncbi:MAG: hypothetical protein Q7U89_00895 [Coriobacteriia bacterium]|nr:hypothetical protein [Coriobacteriia bacterium]
MKPAGDKPDEVRAYTDSLIAESGVTQGDFRDFEAVAEWTRWVAGKLGLS